MKWGDEDFLVGAFQFLVFLYVLGLVVMYLIVLAGCSAKKQLVLKHDIQSNSTHVEVRVELP